MYLETYRESGSFKHFGYEPHRDRDFGGLYCAKSTDGGSTGGKDVVKTTDGGHTFPPPEKP